MSTEENSENTVVVPVAPVAPVVRDERTVFKLDDILYRLLEKEPFYAALSRNINKTPTTSIPTMGIRYNENHMCFELFYNPKFCHELVAEAVRRGKEPGALIAGVLIHEFHHILLLHCTSRTPADKNQHTRWNIAADLAINGMPDIVDILPEMGCFPGKNQFQNLPAMQVAEWYFAQLPEGQGQGEGDGEGGGHPGFDNHDGWDDIPEEMRDLATQQVRQMAGKAMQTASGQGWGSVSAEMRDYIMKLVSTQIDWRQALRYFVKASLRADRRSDPKRTNKRYPFIHPGKRHDRRAHVAISIDMSGSVSNEMMALFWAELTSLSKLATFTVVPFDTEVNEAAVFEWVKGKSHPPERFNCGGTDFDAPTRWVNRHGGFDGHIICTDMEAPKPGNSAVPRLWITDSDHAGSGYCDPTPERVLILQK